MWKRLMLAPAILALGVGMAACDDNDGDGDGEVTTDEVRGEVQEAIDDLQAGANDLADDIDAELDDAELSEIDDQVKEEWNENCRQLSETAEDEDAGSELTDICGDLREGLDNDDGDAVEDARERLGDWADRAEDEVDEEGDDNSP